MKKDYSVWHSIKTFLNQNKKKVYFHPREIWFCRLGLNIGFEQDGSGEKYLRPVLIIKKFNKYVCWVVPLTKTEKNGKYYYSFEYIKGVQSSAMLSQIRLIDMRRLEYLSGYISKKDFVLLKEKLRQLLI